MFHFQKYNLCIFKKYSKINNNSYEITCKRKSIYLIRLAIKILFELLNKINKRKKNQFAQNILNNCDISFLILYDNQYIHFVKKRYATKTTLLFK